MEKGEGGEALANDHDRKPLLNHIVLCGLHLKNVISNNQKAHHCTDLSGKQTDQRSDTTTTGIFHDDPDPRAIKMTTIVHCNIVFLLTPQLTE